MHSSKTTTFKKYIASYHEHLFFRNLFFRVSSLILMGVKLVFVMEGEAPKLKAETMSKRTEMRFGGFQKKAPKPPAAKSTSRGRFNAVLREVCPKFH